MNNGYKCNGKLLTITGISISDKADKSHRKSVSFPRTLNSPKDNEPGLPSSFSTARKRRTSVQFKSLKTKTVSPTTERKESNAWRKIVASSMANDEQKFEEYNSQFDSACRHRSDIGSYNSRNVIGLMFDLEELKKQRARVDVEDELRSIHKRVKAVSTLSIFTLFLINLISIYCI